MSVSLATLSKNMAWTKTPSQKIDVRADGRWVSSQWDGEHTRLSGYTSDPTRAGRARANNGAHGCSVGADRRHYFYTRKVGGRDFTWNKKKENCPRDRVHEFCQNCRQVESSSVNNDRWECMCS